MNKENISAQVSVSWIPALSSLFPRLWQLRVLWLPPGDTCCQKVVSRDISFARAGLCLFCRHYARGRSLYKFVVPFFIVIITVIITHHCWEHMGEARTRQTIWTWKHHFSHSLLWVLWNLGDVRYFLTLWLGTAKCFGSRHRHSYSKCLDRSSKPSLAAASWKRWSPAPWKGTDNSETRISLFTAR